MMEYSTAEVIDGKLVITSTKTINPGNCPHFIMVGKHYRDDGTCRCDDPDHTEMADWGYIWDAGRGAWV